MIRVMWLHRELLNFNIALRGLCWNWETARGVEEILSIHLHFLWIKSRLYCRKLNHFLNPATNVEVKAANWPQRFWSFWWRVIKVWHDWDRMLVTINLCRVKRVGYFTWIRLILWKKFNPALLMEAFQPNDTSKTYLNLVKTVPITRGSIGT